jgi:hypothetical protein
MDHTDMFNMEFKSAIGVFDAPPGRGKTFAACKLCVRLAIQKSVIMCAAACEWQIAKYIADLGGKSTRIANKTDAESYRTSRGIIAIVSEEFWLPFVVGTRRQRVLFDRVIVDDYDGMSQTARLPNAKYVWYLVSTGFSLARAQPHVQLNARILEDRPAPDRSLCDSSPLVSEVYKCVSELDAHMVLGKTVVVANTTRQIAWASFGTVRLSRTTALCNRAIANWRQRPQIPLLLCAAQPGYGLAFGDVESVWFVEPYNLVDAERLKGQCLHSFRISPVRFIYFRQAQ